jgi:hypothetical protein
MPLDFMNAAPPSIVPENNLRLPDALTVKHGPARLLSRFVLEGDKAARQLGLRLRLRHDFDELLFLNRLQAARGNWYPLIDMFNPECVDLNAENAFWISGEDETGEIVATWGARIYDWTGTNLAEQACAMWYGEDRGQPCILTAEAASRITGVVVCGGASWVRPDFRRLHLSRLIPRIGKAYACGRWPIDWSFCYVTRKHVEQGLAAGYGQRNVSYSIQYSGSDLGELVLAYTSADEVYDDLTEFMASELVAPIGVKPRPGSVVTILEHNVMKTSSDGVFHGNNRRS